MISLLFLCFCIPGASCGGLPLGEGQKSCRWALRVQEGILFCGSVPASCVEGLGHHRGQVTSSRWIAEPGTEACLPLSPPAVLSAAQLASVYTPWAAAPGHHEGRLTGVPECVMYVNPVHV